MQTNLGTPPLIGFTLDHEEGGGYSKMPWYAIRENYFTSVSRLGAVPLGLPHELDAVAAYLDLIHGLVVTGGAFDVSPTLYGDVTQHDTVTVKQRRTQFEYAMIKGALARRMPVLGICGGEQLLNVVLGGTLIQHIPDSIENALEHEQKNPRHEPGHTVTISPDTMLHRILGNHSLAVNSAHHQAIGKPAPGAVVNALAPDGVIEGIEWPEHPFCLGVQWHPEYRVTEGDDRILAAFIHACRKPSS